MLSLLGLAGCKQPVEPRTAHYFQTHDADRKFVLDQCKNADRPYQPQEECANAKRAEFLGTMQHDIGPKAK